MGGLSQELLDSEYRSLIKTRFDAKWEPVTESGCWLWIGCMNVDGYGRLKIRGKYRSAHRISYELHVGRIGDDLFVCHKCDVPSCVNPDHLFTGTLQENVADQVRKGRSIIGERNPMSTLTEPQVERILLDTRKTSILAAEFGVAMNTITSIRSGARWRHVKQRIASHG